VAWTIVLVATGIAAGATVALVARVSVAPVEREATSLADRSLPAEAALQATARASARSQNEFLNVVVASDPAAKAAGIDRAQQFLQDQDGAWTTYRALSGDAAGERRLQRDYTATDAALRTSAATLLGLASTDPGSPAALHAEQESAARIQGIVDELERRFYQPASRSSAEAVEVGDTRRNTIVALGAALLVFLGVGIVILRRAMRFERAEARRERAEVITARQADLETRVQRGLEMEATEAQALVDPLTGLPNRRTLESQTHDLLESDMPFVVATSRRATAASSSSWCCPTAPSSMPASSRNGSVRSSPSRSKAGASPRSRSAWASAQPIAGTSHGVDRGSAQGLSGAVPGAPGSPCSAATALSSPSTSPSSAATALSSPSTSPRSATSAAVIGAPDVGCSPMSVGRDHHSVVTSASRSAVAASMPASSSCTTSHRGHRNRYALDRSSSQKRSTIWLRSMLTSPQRGHVTRTRTFVGPAVPLFRMPVFSAHGGES
jgi:hypothetical protein